MFLRFAGIDGSGKTTQVALLYNHFVIKRIPTFVSKAYGDLERQRFSDFVAAADDVARMFLFQALHVEQRRAAAAQLALGAHVIADRWDESYLAYHTTHGLLSQDRRLRARLNTIAFGTLKPELTFFLSLPVEVAMERLKSRSTDYFDAAGKEYHETMARGFEEMARKERWHVLDGTKQTDALHSEVLRVIERRHRWRRLFRLLGSRRQFSEGR